MEPIKGSETSAFRTQTLGNYPKENILHKEHSESLKSKIIYFVLSLNKDHIWWPPKRKLYGARVLEWIWQVPLFVTFTWPSSTAVSNIAVFATVLSFFPHDKKPPSTAYGLSTVSVSVSGTVTSQFRSQYYSHCMHGTRNIMYHCLTSD